MKVLFVCRGNVGRSQMAEAFFKKFSGNSAFSAGTKLSGTGEKLKNLPPARLVIECMEEEGIDLSNKKRKQLTQEMAEQADRIIIMAEKTTVPSYLIRNKKSVFWDVEDPKGKRYEEYCKIRDQIKKLVEELVRELTIRDVEVRKSGIHGKGVFAKRDFKKGDVVLRWDISRILTLEEAEKLPAGERKYVSHFRGDKYILYQKPERYLNHACDANTRTNNDSDVALRNIKKGEEITADYSKENIPGLDMKCLCRSKNCRKIIRNK